MRKPNHFHDANHSVKVAALKVLNLIKAPSEALREALVKICRRKVMREQFCVEAEAAGLATREPTHQDSPTR